MLIRMAKQAFKQGQIGQTIIIVAIAFIVLLAFVGLVTDVSLLFVRYSTLRRAVDAAAVAAAGQVRRTVPNQDEILAANANCPPDDVDDCADGMAFARNLANVNLAARQFIEFYGLNPSNVVVETCATPKVNPINRVAGDDNAYYDQLALRLGCGDTAQPRKLVQVTAEIMSPTVFLRLLGWNDVRLQANAISETAVLDVVMVFDGSESMLNQTTMRDWENVPQSDGSSLTIRNMGIYFVPPRFYTGPNRFPGAPTGTGNAIIDQFRGSTTFPFGVNGFDYRTTAYPSTSAADRASINQLPFAMLQFLLTSTQDQIDALPQFFPVWAYKCTARDANGVCTTFAQATASEQNAMREQCRVRVFPSAEWVGPIPNGNGSFEAENNLRGEYTTILRTQWGMPNATYPAKYDFFMPAYNYFDCCNDPDGANGFDDLICQPFRQVRDSAEDFLDRLDFIRGDRVAFVTFDRYAYLLDPDGEGPQKPMITSQENALGALRNSVGVRAEPSYYADLGTRQADGSLDATTDGLWDALVVGGNPWRPDAADPTTSGTAIDKLNYTTEYGPPNFTATVNAGFDRKPLWRVNDYPLKDNCFLNNALLGYDYSLWSSPPGTTDSVAPWIDYNARPPLASRYPNSLASTQYATIVSDPNRPSFTGPVYMEPNINDRAWDDYIRTKPGFTTWSARAGLRSGFSYELRALCRNSNIGAALREGNNALLDPETIRRVGAVWVMVLLGDGAAGATDPVIRNGTTPPGSNPYVVNPSTGRPLELLPDANSIYGAYGLCPYGSPSDPSQLLKNNSPGDTPRCMDWNPFTRSTCPDQARTGSNSEIVIELPNQSDDCFTKYDTDDFARDWADFVGLERLPIISPFGPVVENVQRDPSRLPIIFTIGFGLNFTADAPSASKSWYDICLDTTDDCLGEELLRYIADVGDNQRLDSNYFEMAVNNFVPPRVDFVYNTDLPGPCEKSIALSQPWEQMVENSYIIAPLPSGQDCGNYYNAPDVDRLQRVLDDIASRMFTRLAR